jgi:cytochrome c-type biogenesis protein CcmH/NrfG
MNFQETLKDFDQFKHDLSLWAPQVERSRFLENELCRSADELKGLVHEMPEKRSLSQGALVQRKVLEMKPSQPHIMLSSSVGYSTTRKTTFALDFLQGDEQKQQMVSESESAQAYEQLREVLQTDPEKYEKRSEEDEDYGEVRVENNSEEDVVDEESESTQ